MISAPTSPFGPTPGGGGGGGAWRCAALVTCRTTTLNFSPFRTVGGNCTVSSPGRLAPTPSGIGKYVKPEAGTRIVWSSSACNRGVTYSSPASSAMFFALVPGIKQVALLPPGNPAQW